MIRLLVVDVAHDLYQDVHKEKRYPMTLRWEAIGRLCLGGLEDCMSVVNVKKGTMTNAVL